MKVPPRFELGSLDSESKVLTITPWDLGWGRVDSIEKSSHNFPLYCVRLANLFVRINYVNCSFF